MAISSHTQPMELLKAIIAGAYMRAGGDRLLVPRWKMEYIPRGRVGGADICSSIKSPSCAVHKLPTTISTRPPLPLPSHPFLPSLRHHAAPHVPRFE